MDIKKLKNFITFKLPFYRPCGASKTLRGTLTEIRVFETAPLKPTCPICGIVLEDGRNKLDRLPDSPSGLAVNEGFISAQADVLQSSPSGWNCQACGAAVIFNKEPDSDVKSMPDRTLDVSR